MRKVPLLRSIAPRLADPDSQMIKNQQGFTLIESLIVLSIFMIISSVTAFTLKPQTNMVNNEAFISQLKADLLYAQQYAISHQHEVKVNFFPNLSMYSMYESNDLPPIVVRNYSPSIIVSPGSLQLSFKFNPNGNVDRFGSFRIQTKDKFYLMTVLIGKGRFYVVEE